MVFLIVSLHACASKANFTAWPPPAIGGNWKKSPVTMSYDTISAARRSGRTIVQPECRQKDRYVS